jgi:hypothetical protein
MVLTAFARVRVAQVRCFGSALVSPVFGNSWMPLLRPYGVKEQHVFKVLALAHTVDLSVAFQPSGVNNR